MSFEVNQDDTVFEGILGLHNDLVFLDNALHLFIIGLVYAFCVIFIFMMHDKKNIESNLKRFRTCFIWFAIFCISTINVILFTVPLIKMLEHYNKLHMLNLDEFLFVFKMKFVFNIGILILGGKSLIAIVNSLDEGLRWNKKIVINTILIIVYTAISCITPSVSDIYEIDNIGAKSSKYSVSYIFNKKEV